MNQFLGLPLWLWVIAAAGANALLLVGPPGDLDEALALLERHRLLTHQFESIHFKWQRFIIELD